MKKHDWKIIYNTKVHKDSAEKFHLSCIGKAPLLIVVKSKDYGHVFGGFTHYAYNGGDMWHRDNEFKNWLFRVRCVVFLF